MKKTAFALLAGVALLTACQANGQKTTLTGNLKGVESDTLLVVTASLTRGGTPLRDTVAMDNGRFVFDVEAGTDPHGIYIYEKPLGNKALSMRAVNLLIFPGDKLALTGDMADYRVEGSDFYVEYNEASPLWAGYEKQLMDLSAKAQEMAMAGVAEDSIARFIAPGEALYNNMVEAKKEYIAGHPDSDVSLYLLATMAMGQGNVEELLPKLTDQVKNGRLAPLYSMMDQEVKRARAREAMQKNVAEGSPAPDFTLKDIEGKDLSLSSLKGKYVVLDFWGSWCSWCIKGIPEMKKYYAKYKDKMEILGIDCRDTEEKWKEAVKKYELPWLHVRNEGNPDVSVLYAIQGYPTKIVVDPEGKIAKVVVGEDPAFYSYLDELFK